MLTNTNFPTPAQFLTLLSASGYPYPYGKHTEVYSSPGAMPDAEYVEKKTIDRALASRERTL